MGWGLGSFFYLPKQFFAFYYSASSDKEAEERALATKEGIFGAQWAITKRLS